MRRVLFSLVFVFNLFLLVSFSSPVAAAESVVKTIISLPAGSEPTMVATDTVHHKAYVISQGVNAVYVIDELSDSLIQTIPLLNNPQGVGIDSSKQLLYISNYYDNYVWVIDAITNTIINTIQSSTFNGPRLIAVDSDANRIYVINDQFNAPISSTVIIINDLTNTVIGSYPVGGQPSGIAVNPLTHRLYVSSGLNQPGLTVIDTITDNIATLNLGTANRSVAIDIVLNRIYVDNQFNGTVFAIDGNTNSILSEFPVHTAYALNPLGLAVDSILHKGYTGNSSGSNIGASVSVFDTNTNMTIQQVSVGSGGGGNLVLFLGLDDSLHKVYVPHFSDGYVAVLVENNTPPSINPIPNVTVNEGSIYSASGSFSDSDSSTSWTGRVDYGDGEGEKVLAIDQVNKTFDLSHVYAENGIYTVTVRVTDDQGATGTETATVTVNNALPIVGAITASVNPILVNTSTTATASFTDAGVLDTHTAVWDWGDGTISSGTINGGVVSDAHIYTTAGVYEITLCVTDDDGGAGTQVFQYLSVYSPTVQGLFSAGQKYTSEYPGISGNARFGLSYKYQGEVPVGNRQFSLDIKSANFKFNATAISSLVIANGVGTLRGSGTVNGGGLYNFLVVGREGLDMIRIKIIDSSNNNAVVYDTQPGASDTADPTTSVTAGNVLAH